jgi:hypothetical protein
MEKADAARMVKGGSGAVLKSMIGPLVILLCAVYFYILAGSIDENPMPGQLGPAFWPKALLILLMISCGIKSLEVYRTTAVKESAAAAKGVLKSSKYWRLLSVRCSMAEVGR